LSTKAPAGKELVSNQQLSAICQGYESDGHNCHEKNDAKMTK
jgi:hypothetical protein